MSDRLPDEPRGMTLRQLIDRFEECVDERGWESRPTLAGLGEIEEVVWCDECKNYHLTMV